MLFKSATMTQASGSIGGMTASHNKGGMYFRSRVIPVNPNTIKQSAVRGYLAELVNNWTNVLDATQRAAWNTYAANVPKVGVLGDSNLISGINWFVGCNVLRPQAGLSYVNDAPTVFNTGAATPPSISSFDTGTPSVDLIFTTSNAWVSEDDAALLVYASRPQNAGVNYFSGPFQYAGAILGNSTTPPTTPATIPLPFAIATGQKVFLRGRVIRADGRRSIDLTLNGTV